jgi:hypothetical protein
MEHYEITEGLEDWLTWMQNCALYWEDSPCETIQLLIDDVQKAKDLGKLPWTTDQFLGLPK